MSLISKTVHLTVLVPVYNEQYLVIKSLSQLTSIKSDLISVLEVIVVDDCSSDKTWEKLLSFSKTDVRIKIFRHSRNQGKGAAIQTALNHATGDVCIIHDADLEYNPEDIPSLLKPILAEGADAVFGSRYLTTQYRGIFGYRHSVINKAITALVNMVTDLDFTDIETCYKAIKTHLFKSIPIRYKDFRFEVEIAMKLARRRARIFEVPIRYLPRTHEEGKKIRFKDGLLAVLAIFRFWSVEDLWKRSGHGLAILLNMNNARKFNRWMADILRPYIGDRVLEIGAGIGSLSSQFIPRDYYLASDIEPYAISYLNSYAIGKPYFHVKKINALDPEDFKSFSSQFDTVLMVNVLEHLSDESTALKNISKSLQSEGRIIVLVPQYFFLYGSFDRAVQHCRRYTKDDLGRVLSDAGFFVEKIFDFNRFAVPSWILNAKILKRKRFSRLQLKILEILMPFIKLFDHFLPWGGLSIVGIGMKKKGSNS